MTRPEGGYLPLCRTLFLTFLFPSLDLVLGLVLAIAKARSPQGFLAEGF